MNSTTISVVNCVFSWSVVALAFGGFIITLKRTGEKWPFWIILAIGWGFLAVFETLLASGVQTSRSQIATVWLTSYLLVMASLLLLFLKFVQMKAKK
jgi:hypothetical protein